MTELVPLLAVLAPALPLAAGVLVQLTRTPAQTDRVNVALALATATVALALAVTVLARGGREPLRGDLYLLDGAAGVFLALIAVIGLCSALVSPSYLRTAGRSWLGAGASRRWYYSALYVFWAVLLAVPIAANLAVAWLLVEATTAASALLIAFTGRREALEAGWKYLVLTTLGLSVALLGIVVLAIAMSQAGAGGLRALDWQELERRAAALPEETTLVAFVLLLAGLATKIGWAPVHNWLPDAHSEAPAPVSALLSAALLPTVLLVAWRSEVTLDAAVGLAATVDAALQELRELRTDAAAAWRELEFTGSVQTRFDGVGAVAREDAQRLGAAGPAARASGLRADVRTTSPRLAYGGFAPAAPLQATGDVAARVQVRAAELETTCDLLEELLARPLEPGGCTRVAAPRAPGIGHVESPRGATLAAVELDGDRVARLRLRTGSYANWPVLAHAVVGNLLPDFPLINKSFELCYACVDR